ncbi:glycosyltransferase family 2 protein [Psychromonas sp.]|uniref:glycosyltransferase family 2 protein n=1 Tax=Psychromonas sp. TaxID=1884585 RepID=UPI003566F5B9
MSISLNITHGATAPQVSVVIPMYNVAKYITRCISSVLLQSFSDFEIICVDDGCTDNTLELLAAFTDPRITLIRQANRGLAGARNSGINQAKGEYIALLDSDDFWHKDKLKMHVAHLNNNLDVGISYCPSLFVDEDDNPLGIGQFPKLKNITQRDIFCRNPIGNGSAPVIRRAMLTDYCSSLENNSAGGVDKEADSLSRVEYFNEQLKQSEDIELWTRLCLNSAWKFEGIAQPLTYYRVNENGLSSNLEAQFTSWKTAMGFNQQQHPKLFEHYYELAKAYQYRYFARRSIQSGDSKQAWFYIKEALKTNSSILLQEPGRTVNTLLCAALIKIMPVQFYKSIEQIAMASIGKFNQLAKG